MSTVQLKKRAELIVLKNGLYTTLMSLVKIVMTYSSVQMYGK